MTVERIGYIFPVGYSFDYSELVSELLYLKTAQILSDEFTYKIGDGLINKGVALTLNEDLNIKFGK